MRSDTWCGPYGGTPPVGDTQAPSIPTNLTTTVISSSQINLSWSPSTDNVGVTGYRVYRNGTQIAIITSGASFQNIGLSTGTTYSYTVAAYDAAGNVSWQSTGASATAYGAPAPDITPPTASITAPTANQQFAAGTIQGMLSVTTNEAATCRWNTTDVTYGSMVNTLNGGGGTNHTATLTGLANGQSYTRYIRCSDTAGNSMTNSATVSFSVANAQNATTGNILFESDWSNSTGNSATALRDGAKWTTVLGSGDSMYVVPSTGLDFPTANVLRVEQINGGSAKGVIGEALWPLPAIGETLYKRIYWRNGAKSSVPAAGFNHPVQSCRLAGSNCGDLWLNHNYPGTPTPWTYFINTQDGTAHVWSLGPVMAYDTTYRMEWAMTRLSTNTWRLQARVYDSSNNLLYSDADFFDEYNNNLRNMASAVTTTNDPASQQDSLIGWQGGDGATGEYLWFGAFCVRSDTWCGPYSGVALAVDTQAPSIPTNLSATTISSSQVNLSWTASTDNIGVSGYRIYRCAGGGCTPTIQVATSTGTTFSNILGITAGTTYVYRVAAYDAAGNVSTQSTSASVTTPGGGGGGVAILFAAQWRATGNTSIQRTDNGRFQTSAGSNVVTAASTGISGWPTENVLRVPAAANDVAGSNLRISLGNLPDLAVGASRYYRVYFASTLDNADLSNPPDNSAHPIENIHVPGADEEYGLGTWWKNASGVSITPTQWNWSMFTETGHFREATGGGFPQPIIAINQYEVYRIEWAIHRISTTQYTMQARRYNAAGVLQADERNLYRDAGTSLANFTETIIDAASFRQFAVGSNQGGFMPAGSAPQSYQAAVAISDEGWLGPYNAATEANWDGSPPPTGDTQAPTRPTNLSATAISSSQINLSWSSSTDNVGVTGYRVYRNGVQIAIVTSGAFYQNTGLSPVTTYTYTVAAYDAAGNASLQSAPVSVATQAVPVVSPPAGSSEGSGGGGAAVPPLVPTPSVVPGGGGSEGNVTPVAPTFGAVVPLSDRNFSFTRVLYRGVRGGDVGELQRLLQRLGFFSKTEQPTDYFGPITEAAVQAFQRAYQIVSSGAPGSTGYGNVGPLTRAKLNSLLGSTKSESTKNEITSSDVSPAVKLKIQELQLELQRLQKELKTLLELTNSKSP